MVDTIYATGRVGGTLVQYRTVLYRYCTVQSGIVILSTTVCI